ncbi:hypothetical protein RF11_04965 [Thelohanellus kitauei]|uniref:Uncharacterized protein n=1 Tax=Thelohanellus kitauei TaxID=669202 RepID=A0A0C2MFD6_THEKT|nr:hypothetical protein RF11_04965 [Thelohanellus kitauei]
MRLRLGSYITLFSSIKIETQICFYNTIILELKAWGHVLKNMFKIYNVYLEGQKYLKIPIISDFCCEFAFDELTDQSRVPIWLESSLFVWKSQNFKTSKNCK